MPAVLPVGVAPLAYRLPRYQIYSDRSIKCDQILTNDEMSSSSPKIFLTDSEVAWGSDVVGGASVAIFSSSSASLAVLDLCKEVESNNIPPTHSDESAPKRS